MEKDRTEQPGQRSFEEAMRQKMSALNRKPEDRVWQRLDSSLGKEGSRRPAAWRNSALAVLVLLLVVVTVGVLAFRYFQQQEPAAAISHNSNASAKEAQGRAAEPTSSRNTETADISTPEPATTTKAAAQSRPETNTAAFAKKQTPPAAIAQASPASKSSEAGLPERSSSPKKQIRKATPAAALPAAERNKAASPDFSDAKNSGRNNPPERAELTTVTPANPPKTALALPGKTEAAKSPNNLAAPAKTEQTDLTIPAISSSDPASKADVSLATESELAAIAPETDTLAPGADSVSEEKPAPETAALTNAVPDSVQAGHALLTSPDSVKSAPAPSPKNRSSWSLTFFAGPGFFDQNLKMGEKPRPGVGTSVGTNPFTAAATEFNHQTARAPSYKTGLLVGIPLLQNLRFEGGLGFSKRSMRSDVQYIASDVVFVGVNGVEYTNHQPLITMVLNNPNFESQSNASLAQTDPYQINFDYQYLHLPLRLQAFYDLGKWRGFVAAGAEANRLVKSQVTATDAQTEGRNLIPESKGIFREWLWAGTLSGGVGYALSERLMLQTSADFYRYFSPIVNMTKIRETEQAPPKFFSLSAGITYSFRRK